MKLKGVRQGWGFRHFHSFSVFLGQKPDKAGLLAGPTGGFSVELLELLVGRSLNLTFA